MQSLHTAIKAHDLNQVRELLNQGVDVNQKNNDGDTPLHIAAALGQHETIKLLIETGAHLDIHDGWDLLGRTPLHRAVIGGHVDITKTLIRAGADINAKRWDGCTTLGWAKATNQVELAELLKELGGQ